jgi:hypothetical protein
MATPFWLDEKTGTILNAHNYPVAHVFAPYPPGLPTKHAMEQAVFLVKCVNTHHELLAAAKRALEYADPKYAYVVQLKMAIAKATFTQEPHGK